MAAKRHTRIFLTALVVSPLLAGLTLAVVLNRPDPRKTPTGDWTPVGTSTQTRAPLVALKAPIVGLLDRHNEPALAQRVAVGAYVVDVTWAELQPNPGQAIVRDNAIDRAVVVARRDGLLLKLRVRAGLQAPTWAKNIGGPPITIYHTRSHPTTPGALAGTIGRFWLPEFSSAYASLQVKLAAIYDNVPEIRQTDISQCSMIYSESYLRNTQNPLNVTALQNAGYRRGADEQCHRSQLAAHRVWRTTRTDVAFNPFTAIEDDGSLHNDLAYTVAQMSLCRSILGDRCVLQNNSAASSRLYNGDYQRMYDQMRSLGSPINFQTDIPTVIGDHNEVLTWSASRCASSVELPSNYPTWPAADLDAALVKLRARTGCPVP